MLRSSSFSCLKQPPDTVPQPIHLITCRRSERPTARDTNERCSRVCMSQRTVFEPGDALDEHRRHNLVVLQPHLHRRQHAPAVLRPPQHASAFRITPIAYVLLMRQQPACALSRRAGRRRGGGPLKPRSRLSLRRRHHTESCWHTPHTLSCARNAHARQRTRRISILLGRSWLEGCRGATEPRRTAGVNGYLLHIPQHIDVQLHRCCIQRFAV